MSSRRWTIWTLAALVLGGAEARAHFLFAKVGPMAEGGRSAEVYFSDKAEAGDPKFVDKLAPTKLWAQSAPGEFRPLNVRKGVDRLNAHVPASGAVAVVGECQYGVIARPGETPFLLRYYPKAVAGPAAELNKMKTRDGTTLYHPKAVTDLNALKPREGATLEIAAEFEGDRIKLLALRDGKPLPKASFHAVDADLKESVIAADDEGRAGWTPTSSGTYTLYFRSDSKTSGEVDGKKYDEIREFATLAFDWPLVATGADAEAVSRFEDAIAARASWKDFPGFSAQVAGQVEGRPFAGSVTVDAEGKAKAELDEPSAKSWVEGQIGSIAMHRIAQEPGDRPVLRFLDDDEGHPLGRLLAFEGGHFASSYRIKDRQITSVNRKMGALNMTIITLDNEKTADGHFLPLGYSVQYWDDLTGDLRRTESIRDRWVRVGPFDLPASHLVTTASDGGQSTKGLTLTGHELAK